MKKLLFAVCALAAISLLAPNAGFAQEWKNRIGIYTTATATDDHFATNPVGQFNIYFLLTSPQMDDGTPITQLDAFEFKVTITGTPGMFFKLAQTLPPNSLNVGQDSDAYAAEYAVGAASPFPVTGGIAQLMSWNCMVVGGGPFSFFLNQTSAPSLPGHLAISIPLEGGSAQLVACEPSSGDFASSVFGIGSDPTGVENETFGSVKALFR